VIEQPEVIVRDSFQAAWIAAARRLQDTSWQSRNLIVQVTDPTNIDLRIHEDFCRFAEEVTVLPPKDVAYTIFPHGLYRKSKDRAALYSAYNRPGGLYQRTVHRVPGSWGTYFRRMTCYETAKGAVNQLEQVINAMLSDERVFKGAFSITIPVPGGETRRRRGGPCLNYIAVQRTEGSNTEVGLLCVYRSHDFLERAYGNYWGLCNLLGFIASETQSRPGPLTCISSLAFVPSHKTELCRFLRTLP
jgi:hypothetical protein